jgi:hypothetical protein
MVIEATTKSFEKKKKRERFFRPLHFFFFFFEQERVQTEPEGTLTLERHFILFFVR